MHLVNSVMSDDITHLLWYRTWNQVALQGFGRSKLWFGR